MRRGKECAMASHAAMGFLVHRLPNVAISEEEQAWFDNGTKKVCCQVDSEEEMLAIVERAKAAGLNTYTVLDEGLTEFGGVHKLTAAAIGPHYEDRFAGVTDDLRLY